MQVDARTQIFAADREALEASPSIDRRLVMNPAMAVQFRALGLTSPEAFLAIPGEIVSGHPDRHVRRVVLDGGRVAYLKREHRIRRKDRLRNWRANFGWSCNSVREGLILRELESRGLPAPRWLAFGEDDHGHAFLLIEEAPGGIDIRRLPLETANLDSLAVHLGRLCAELHEAGVDHPDLWSKHFLVNPSTFETTIIDWPRATLGQSVSWTSRVRALAKFRATLVAPHDKYFARFLWAYCRVVRGYRGNMPRFSPAARAIEREAARLLRRRGVHDQRQPLLDQAAQRLVWLDGEALCAIPEAAAELDCPTLRARLYDMSFHGLSVPLLQGIARLEIGGYRAIVSRCWSWLRGRAWRSPELRKARLLFHLQRHHVPAPRLIAYGQRCRRLRADAFVLTAAVGATEKARRSLRMALGNPDEDMRLLLLRRLAEILHRLHDAGCEATTVDAFGVSDDDGNVAIIVTDPDRLTFRKKLSARRQRADVARLARSIGHYCGPAELAYFHEAMRESS